MRSEERPLRVCVFCGGRGSASILRELVRRPNVRVSLIVNAYDDGLSTGELRDFIPGMLGPSDFRKNVANLLHLYSHEQYVSQRVLEYRFPTGTASAAAEALAAYAHEDGRAAGGLEPPLRGLFEDLEPSMRAHIRRALRSFFDYHRAERRAMPFDDCSLGNLVFAGVYLASGRSFNRAAREMARIFRSQAEVLNISSGENRVLVALKADGAVLHREAEIVGPQGPAPIRDVFFFEHPLTPAERAVLDGADLEKKWRWLKDRDRRVALSLEAAEALRAADVIVYGPGTQFSSLLPSYCTEGVREAIRESKARLKVFVVNLHADHDIRGLGATDLVDRCLEMLGDADNLDHSVTHVLYDRGSRTGEGGVRLDGAVLGPDGTYKGALVVEGDFANPVMTTVHSGYAVAREILQRHEDQAAPKGRETIDLYIDLLDRSVAAGAVLQEFCELPWSPAFERVRLRVNRLAVAPLSLPPHLEVKTVQDPHAFSEVDVLREWLAAGDSAYLVTISGDGEYRLSDVFLGIQVLNSGTFGAVFGSRNQSRRQFRSSLTAAYGERGVLYRLSWLGAFVLTALFGLRFQLVFSDPLTGFRIYKRSRLNAGVRRALLSGRPSAAASVTRILLENNVEIAEIPVSYRTYAGFTQVSWRLRRGVENLLGLFVSRRRGGRRT